MGEEKKIFIKCSCNWLLIYFCYLHNSSAGENDCGDFNAKYDKLSKSPVEMKMNLLQLNFE